MSQSRSTAIGKKPQNMLYVARKNRPLARHGWPVFLLHRVFLTAHHCHVEVRRGGSWRLPAGKPLPKPGEATPNPRQLPPLIAGQTTVFPRDKTQYSPHFNPDRVRMLFSAYRNA